MEYIESKENFKLFMKNEGLANNTSNNYITWLEFIAKKGFPINKELKNNSEIIDFLKKDEQYRDNYQDKGDYSNFVSALNKYRKFITTKSNLVDDIEAIKKDSTISETQKELLTFARIGQGKYRKDLIELWEKCSVSECNMTDLLIASHIKPWSESSNEEKLDPYNGLLLLPNYDKLFDKHLISFDDDGKIIISPQIKKEEYKVLGISANDKLFNVFKQNKPYLKTHRKKFYDKINKTNQKKVLEI
ncbi:HNH endonuclease [Capnocytophaga gingivalis]|jgi:hypothetical protein|uniref:HNH endonuclease n=1 Tax=Capnocytophaga gingivalis TaxID=1017 RepID=UPI0028D43B13|nr:HNH endonuclease [Capnocytophaga gingivalis]